MGKVSVSGLATRVVPHDQMAISMTVSAKGKNLREVNLTSQKRSNSLLEALAEAGLDLAAVKLEQDTIEKTWGPDNAELLQQSRVYKLEGSLDLRLLNTVSALLSENIEDGSFRVSFARSDAQDIQSQLIREALLDSRAKAQMIADTLGQKLLGLDQIEVAEQINEVPFPRAERLAYGAKALALRDSGPADRLGPSEVRFERQVHATWLIE
ncbi:MAG: SIMPL domain-containing protein [Clostridia bacterium]|nr:SIMPL domain-containing protein [Clostridia bacterium]